MEDKDFLEYELYLSWEIMDILCEKYDIDFDHFLENMEEYEEQDGEDLIHFHLSRISDLIEKIEVLDRH